MDSISTTSTTEVYHLWWYSDGIDHHRTFTSRAEWRVATDILVALEETTGTVACVQVMEVTS